MVRGQDPQSLGWQPIAGEEFVFEMTVNCLLPPGANGVPEWNPDEKAEKQMVKLPGQFRSFLATGKPLSAEIGRQLATWATGSTIAPAIKPDPVKVDKPTETPTDREQLASWLNERTTSGRITPEMKKVLFPMFTEATNKADFDAVKEKAIELMGGVE